MTAKLDRTLPSDISLPEGSKAVPLGYGKFAIVDEADYEWLMQWVWHYRPNGYAARNKRVNEDKEDGVAMMMHRQIMETPSGMATDHINGNPLDNRRSNLRICTNRQNQRNRRKQKDPLTTPYKGVYWCNRQKSYIAQIMIDKRNKYIGAFDSPEKAALAYNARATELFGEYALLNDVVAPDGFALKQKVYSSKYKGVHWHKRLQRWLAKIIVNGKQIHLGVFKDEKEAAMTYQRKVEELGMVAFNFKSKQSAY